MKTEKQHKIIQSDLIQPKRDGSKLSFVDNRLQTEIQIKFVKAIQKKENKIGFLDNLKTGVENFSSFSILPIYQLTIDKSKLNLAGEDHNDSNSRRADEVAFCREKMEKENDFYWVENDFKNQDGRQADSQRLLLDQALSFLIEYKDKDFASLDTSRVVRSIGQLSGLEIALELQIYELKCINLFQGIINDIANLAKIQYNIDMKKMPEEIKAAIDDIVTKRNNIPQAISPAMGHSVMDVRKERSLLMHKAANSSDKKGVWKIGQDHVDDIISNERIYNLLFCDEFNEEYNTWKKGQVKSLHSTAPQ